MTAPQRVRLCRQAGFRLPATTVSVAYPTKWANPFRPSARGAATNLAAVRRYVRYLEQRSELVTAVQHELAGKNLACWCPAHLACHADVLLQLAVGIPLAQVRLRPAA